MNNLDILKKIKKHENIDTEAIILINGNEGYSLIYTCFGWKTKQGLNNKYLNSKELSKLVRSGSSIDFI